MRPEGIQLLLGIGLEELLNSGGAFPCLEDEQRARLRELGAIHPGYTWFLASERGTLSGSLEWARAGNGDMHPVVERQNPDQVVGLVSAVGTVGAVDPVRRTAREAWARSPNETPAPSPAEQR